MSPFGLLCLLQIRRQASVIVTCNKTRRGRSLSEGARGAGESLHVAASGICATAPTALSARTRSTRIEVDALTPRRLEASRHKALVVLNEDTEVLRLKDREVRIRDSPLIIG